MWLVWFSFGVVAGGAIMHIVVQNDARSRLRNFIEALLLSLECEEEYPRSRGSTKRTLEGLLKELEHGK